MKQSRPIIDVIIPAFNEENAVGMVVAEIPAGLVREVVVCDNNSSDRTSDAARAQGATVVEENRKGYGYACLKAMDHIAKKPKGSEPDIVVFLDADHSDYPQEMPNLLRPITENGADLVIGSRALGQMERGAMTPHQIFGNWLATSLIRLFYKYEFTDLGPFRAIRYEALKELEMQDKTYGWTVEMQVKAAKKKMKCVEVPVNYRKRIGKSKVSGTVKGSLLAGQKILWTIFKSL